MLAFCSGATVCKLQRTVQMYVYNKSICDAIVCNFTILKDLFNAARYLSRTALHVASIALDFFKLA